MLVYCLVYLKKKTNNISACSAAVAGVSTMVRVIVSVRKYDDMMKLLSSSFSYNNNEAKDMSLPAGSHTGSVTSRLASAVRSPWSAHAKHRAQTTAKRGTMWTIG